MANHRGGSGNFAEDRERASEAGRKGGQHSGGNFKNDPQRASEAGKKGVKTATAATNRKSGYCQICRDVERQRQTLRSPAAGSSGGFFYLQG
jgi:general stress protein YciG